MSLTWRRSGERLSAFAIFGAWLTACLPTDTRPQPASVLVTVTPAASVIEGISRTSTADGWSIAFDEFLLAVGRVSLDGAHCSSYSEASYLRLYNALIPGTQKLSESFALGQCDIGFHLSNPDDETVLGAGVNEEEVVFMRTPGADPYAGFGGVSMYVRGHAQKGDTVKTFGWSFRQRVNYSECTSGPNVGGVRGLALAEAGAATLDLEIHGEALFQDQLRVGKSFLRFDPIADADTRSGDGDGDVTLDELALVQLSKLATDGSYSASMGGPDVGLTLRDYVYQGAYTDVVRFSGTGTCTVSSGHGD